MNARPDSQKGTLIGVAVIIAGGIVAGLLIGRGETAPAATPVVDAKTPSSPVTPAVAPVSTPATAKPVVTTSSEDALAGLANDSMSGPAASRLAAIEKLSKAPRDQALPLLKRALLNGEPGVDRPAALRGLRELALSQGDSDQRIRDALREAIYHGDDAAFAAEAQATLDTIAASETGSPH